MPRLQKNCLRLLMLMICVHLFKKYGQVRFIISRKYPNHVPYQGIFKYNDMDPNNVVPWTYDERFKNPCWYEQDSLHCLPYYFIIGVKKCGTTTIYRYLMKHPESIVLATKEPQFFVGRDIVNNSDGIQAYIKMFSNASKKIEQHSHDAQSTKFINNYIFCDGSVTYLHNNNLWQSYPGNAGLKEPRYVVLDYINRLLPKAKIILAVRDPVDRLYSDYYFSLKRDNEVAKVESGPKHFHELVVKAIREYQGCLNSYSLRYCVYSIHLIFKDKRSLFRYSVSLSLGMYYVYMQDLLRLFPWEQILLVKSTEIGTHGFIRRMFDFLEMSPVSDSVWRDMTRKETANVRTEYFHSKGAMLNMTRKLLYQFYRPFNDKMAALTGDSDLLFKFAAFE